MNPKELLELAAARGIPLSADAAKKLAAFLPKFLETNSQVNLSAIRDAAGVVEKHFLDSLALAKFADLGRDRVLDLGSGGGFPGIPLACQFPETDFTLLDSVGKKVRAQDSFCAALGLKNARGLWCRAEDVPKRPDFRPYDLVVSRATAFFPQLLAWALPLLKKGGHCAFYKLANPEEMAAGREAAARLGAEWEREETYSLAGQERAIVFLRKS